jgi:hypothetical protein
VPSTSLWILSKMLGQNHFAEPNWHVVTFIHPIFFCKGHVLSTGGAALTHRHEKVDRIKWDSFKYYHLDQSLCSLSQLLIILLTWKFSFGCFHWWVIHYLVYVKLVGLFILIS